jgi:hypothetical protein
MPIENILALIRSEEWIKENPTFDVNPEIVQWAQLHAEIWLKRWKEGTQEKTRNRLIKQAIDRMEEANRERRIEKREKEAKEIEAQEAEESKLRARGKITTIGNKYGYRFVVPLEVYSNNEYREYLDYAKTTKSVKVIVDAYYRKHKKKHRWNKS